MGMTLHCRMMRTPPKILSQMKALLLQVRHAGKNNLPVDYSVREIFRFFNPSVHFLSASRDTRVILFRDILKISVNYQKKAGLSMSPLMMLTNTSLLQMLKNFLHKF